MMYIYAVMLIKLHPNSITEQKKQKPNQTLCRYNLKKTCFSETKTHKCAGRVRNPTPKPHAHTHCVKNNFFFLTIISKHICTTPFDCFDLEW